MTPQPSTEQGPGTQPEAFEVAEALNKKGFAEYLANFGDFTTDIEEGKTEAIAGYYEAFVRSEVASKDLKNLFIGEIKNDLGMSLDKTELDSMDAYIAKERISDPEAVAQLGRALETFQLIKKSIVDREKDLEKAEADFRKQFVKVGGEAGIADLKAKVATQELEMLELSAQKIKVEGNTHSFAEGRQLAKKHKGGWFGRWTGFAGKEVIGKEIKDLNEQITKLAATIKQNKGVYENIDTVQTNIADLARMRTELQERYKVFKEFIFEKTDADKKIRNSIQKKMLTKLDDVINPADPKKRTLKDTEAQQKALDSIRGAEMTKGDIADAEIDKVQADLDQAIESEFNEEVDAAIAGIKTNENGAFNNLEKVLKPYCTGERANKLGSKEGEEARNFIITTLELRRDDPANKGAKSLLLSLIIRNLKQASTN